MAENGTWTEERVLASDVWNADKSLGPMSPEEEVEARRKTARMLDNLCGMADALMLEPLILALGDALGRSQEELRRAEDRLSRPEGARLGPREQERLKGLLVRADALSGALDALADEEWPAPGHKAEYENILREMHRDAQEAFARYRSEVGICD